MATLQRFKLLATQCMVAGSPPSSPSTSPVTTLRRRRKTLRMLFGRGSGSGRRLLPRRNSLVQMERDRVSPEKRKELGVRHRLKDLFVSSPPIEEKSLVKIRCGGEGGNDSGGGGGGGGLSVGGWVGRRGIQRSRRPFSRTLRQRLLLGRAWRPVLVTIPE